MIFVFSPHFHRGGSVDNLLITFRSATQFVGALTMLDPNFFGNRWRAKAVARTAVEVVRMNRQGLDTFLTMNPLSQVHLRASMARARAEITKLEALEKIAEKQYKRRAKKRVSFRRAAAAAEAEPVGMAGFAQAAGADVFALVSKLRDGLVPGMLRDEARRAG
jgi:hypothetical protein